MSAILNQEESLDPDAGRAMLTLSFPTEEHRETFLGWFCDGGGEDGYFVATLTNDSKPIEDILYDNALREWGWDELKNPTPTVVFI